MQEETDQERRELLNTLVGAARRCRYVGLSFPAWLIDMAIADLAADEPSEPQPTRELDARCNLSPDNEGNERRRAAQMRRAGKLAEDGGHRQRQQLYDAARGARSERLIAIPLDPGE